LEQINISSIVGRKLSTGGGLGGRTRLAITGINSGSAATSLDGLGAVGSVAASAGAAQGGNCDSDSCASSRWRAASINRYSHEPDMVMAGGSTNGLRLNCPPLSDIRRLNASSPARSPACAWMILPSRTKVLPCISALEISNTEELL